MQFILVQILLWLLVIKGQNNVCPPAADLFPCTCTGSSGAAGQGVLTCARKNLNDDLVSQILDQFNNPQLLNFLYKVELSRNQLTRIPTIHTGAFNPFSTNALV